MADIDDNEEAYLEFPKEHVRQIAPPNTVWAKIGDDLQLEVLRWDIIQVYALEYDMVIRAEQEPSQSQVICKLLMLVRDQTRKECGEKIHEANKI
jgi:hypothetical protein